MASANPHLWGMSLKRGLMGSMTIEKRYKQGGGVAIPRIGLSYVPTQPLKIFGRHKEK